MNYLEAARLLLGIQALLSEVDDVSAVTALRDVANLRFDRSMNGWSRTLMFTRRLLAGIGHDLGSGSAKTFVFLLDMNRVFERYVHAVLESHFRVAVEEQKPVGNLLRIHPGSICQLADYFWCDSSGCWIGDAKYKHLAKGHSHALRFSDLEAEQSDELAPLAGQILSAGDIRQLTVYAELFRLRGQLASFPGLMLLYPFVGPAIECLPDNVTTWNGSNSSLCLLLVKAQTSVGNAIRFPALHEALVG